MIVFIKKKHGCLHGRIKKGKVILFFDIKWGAGRGCIYEYMLKRALDIQRGKKRSVSVVPPFE